ncbi:MAG: R3H domain-containing nucleic acid-binding protein [Candidatus Peribacteraceae bacterium]
MEALITLTLGRLLTALAIPFEEVKVRQDGDVTRVDIVCPEPSRLIGWHGETLNAVQHLLKSMLRTAKNLERAPFLVLDVDGYRLMQEEKVKKIAEAKADFVRRTGARVTLSPMSPYFRRIVHMHVANTPELADLATESVGEGDYRQVVIRLKEEDKLAEGQELSPVIDQVVDDGLENLDV